VPTWGHKPEPSELAAIARAAEQFRQKWKSIRPPWPAELDGTVTDVHAIDYLEYESIEFPACGIDGAALLCGEVLRRAGCLEWVITYRGDWMLVTPKDHAPPIAICPSTRVLELEYGAGPQFGKYLWFLHQMALQCLASVVPEARSAVLDLFRGDRGESDYLTHVAGTLQLLRAAGLGPQDSRRGRK
jgi:hypothetical protein